MPDACLGESAGAEIRLDLKHTYWSVPARTRTRMGLDHATLMLSEEFPEYVIHALQSPDTTHIAMHPDCSDADTLAVRAIAGTYEVARTIR